jgi:glycosyltransferase involved in cell wall biosynthesis
MSGVPFDRTTMIRELSMNVSVLVLSQNEEINLPACLESVKWSDDIVVLDDGSTDRTIEIAESYGARVIRHSAGGELVQRTYAVRQIPFKHPWVYNPDADEVTPPELRDEMLHVVADRARKEVAFRVRFKVMFMGRWIKYSSLYPTWVVRLFRPERLRFERTANLRYIVDGDVGFLQSHFFHYTFSKGMDAWWEKHRRYAEAEAGEALKSLQTGHWDREGLLAWSDPVRRRQAVKELSFRLPCRPLFRFLYMYIVKCGFLDGYPGLVYCRLLATYERMIVTKMRELGH